MARHLRGALNADQIAHLNRCHFTAEKLEAAIRDITNRFHRFTRPRYWGDEKRVAADGTQYELAEENLLVERQFAMAVMGALPTIMSRIPTSCSSVISSRVACGKPFTSWMV